MRPTNQSVTNDVTKQSTEQRDARYMHKVIQLNKNGE